MRGIRDEIVASDYARFESRLHREGQPAKQVIVIGGDGYSAAAIQRMIGDKVAGDQYTILTREEAIGRGLLQDEVDRAPVPLLDAPAPFSRRRPSTKPISNPERDAWNAAVDQRKAAKRRAKGK